MMNQHFLHSVEPLLRGHPEKRTSFLERPLDKVNMHINELILPLIRGHPSLNAIMSGAKGVASQEGFHCIYIYIYSYMMRGQPLWKGHLTM